MPCNPIIEMSTVVIVMETLITLWNVEKHYRNVKITSHYHNLYKPAEHFLSGLGRFLEYWKRNIRISYNTSIHALPDIYTYPWVLHALRRRAYILGKALLPVL